METEGNLIEVVKKLIDDMLEAINKEKLAPLGCKLVKVEGTPRFRLVIEGFEEYIVETQNDDNGDGPLVVYSKEGQILSSFQIQPGNLVEIVGDIKTLIRNWENLSKAEPKSNPKSKWYSNDD